jgi:calcineurin-like phosphoesterase family protein
MDETIITNWNSIVQPNDLIFHLGDFAFGDARTYIKRLKGQIHFITGSHDKNTKCCANMFASYSPLRDIVIDNITIVLCHYAMRVWKKSHYGSWHLYGHSHNGLSHTPYGIWGKSFDCGQDTEWPEIHSKFYPYSFDEVKLIMSKLPDNFNLVKERKY